MNLRLFMITALVAIVATLVIASSALAGLPWDGLRASAFH
jgi:hypothetical protein